MARGMTKVELAERAGVRQATVSSLETRPIETIDVGVLERIAAALEIDPALLIRSEPDGRKPRRS